MFIPPKYQCDCCNKQESASWTGQSNCEIPDNWLKVDNYHYCLSCLLICSCGNCDKISLWQCEKNKRNSKKWFIPSKR